MRCKYCNLLVGGITKKNLTDACWKHLQIMHPDKYEEVKDLNVQEMLRQCFQTLFIYQGHKVFAVIVNGKNELDIAKDQKVELIKLKEERIKIFFFYSRVIGRKYHYMSQSLGAPAFCYAFEENHGPKGHGVYLLISQGDFEDLNDLFYAYMDFLMAGFRER